MHLEGIPQDLIRIIALNYKFVKSSTLWVFLSKIGQTPVNIGYFLSIFEAKYGL